MATILKIATTAQEPIYESQLEDLFFHHAINGSPQDFAKIIAYSNGHAGKPQGYRTHVELGLAHIFMAQRMQDRGTVPPIHDDQKWDAALSNAVSHLGTKLPARDVIITPTIDQLEEQDLNDNYPDEYAAFKQKLCDEFAQYAVEYAHIRKQQRLGGKQGRALEAARKELQKTRLNRVPPRPTFDEISITSLSEILHMEDLACAIHAANTKNNLGPLDDKEWQSELLHNLTQKKDFSGDSKQKEEVAKLFDRGQLSFLEAAMVLTGAFRNFDAEAIIDYVNHFSLVARHYDSYNYLTPENTKTKLHAAIEKTITTAQDNNNVASQLLVKNMKLALR